MKKNLPIIVFIIILIAVLSVAISIVAKVYNKNRPVTPDINLENLNELDKSKIKAKYSTEEKKNEFIKLCEDIELKVANIILDGTVTNEDELSEKIENINKILASDDWSKLEMTKPEYWMGTFSLDEKGSLKFKFSSPDIKPDWVKDEEVEKYIK